MALMIHFYEYPRSRSILLLLLFAIFSVFKDGSVFLRNVTLVTTIFVCVTLVINFSCDGMIHLKTGFTAEDNLFNRFQFNGGASNVSLYNNQSPSLSIGDEVLWGQQSNLSLHLYLYCSTRHNDKAYHFVSLSFIRKSIVRVKCIRLSCLF